jgi:hypothetical protein
MTNNNAGHESLALLAPSGLLLGCIIEVALERALEKLLRVNKEQGS